MAVITIADNGDRLAPRIGPSCSSLMSRPPRKRAPGLGLAPIVKKIIEEHGGTLECGDAEPFEDGAASRSGACITLPILPYEETA